MLPLLLALAVGIVPPSPPAPRAITTMGDAKVTFRPNQVVASFLVSAQHKDQATAKRTLDEKMAKVLKAVRDAGVDSSNVMMNDLGSSPDYRGSEVIGYINNRTLTVTITDMAKVDETLAAAVRSGATPNGSVVIQNTEHSAFETRARIAAATAARERAKGLTEALGARLGMPATITDHTSAVESQNAGSFSVAADGSVSTAFATKVMTASSQVTVAFDIEPVPER